MGAIVPIFDSQFLIDHTFHYVVVVSPHLVQIVQITLHTNALYRVISVYRSCRAVTNFHRYKIDYSPRLALAYLQKWSPQLYLTRYIYILAKLPTAMLVGHNR